MTPCEEENFAEIVLVCYTWPLRRQSWISIIFKQFFHPWPSSITLVSTSHFCNFSSGKTTSPWIGNNKAFFVRHRWIWMKEDWQCLDTYVMILDPHSPTVDLSHRSHRISFFFDPAQISNEPRASQIWCHMTKTTAQGSTHRSNIDWCHRSDSPFILLRSLMNQEWQTQQLLWWWWNIKAQAVLNEGHSWATW